MGVIDEGSISGVLPSAKFFAVHYPGYPSSVTRAVETLGGTDGIVKARSSQSKLELHFRPEDPYSHPAFGELYPCNNFLLKISKKVGEAESAVDRVNTSNFLSADSTNQDQKSSCQESLVTENVMQPGSELISTFATVEAQTSEEVQGKLFADIVGRVSESYHFSGMADYQHVLAVHADVSRRKKRNWADMDPQFEKRGLLDLDQEDLMILVPPLFSPKDMPEKVVLKPSMEVSLKQKQMGVVKNRWEMNIEPGLALDFSNEVPSKVNWEKYIAKDTDQWEWQMAVCNLFEERPIWKKDSLTEQLLKKGLTIGDNTLRRLLFRAAYYFSNGPFLRFYIRRGYDPRKDVESRVYQRIDFRVPPLLRNYCDANIGSKHRWSDICSFRVFPYKCQTSLQLFELADDYIQKEIRTAATQPTCSLARGWFSPRVMDTFRFHDALATGWFSPRVIDTLRFRVAVRFLEIYPKEGAEPLLKYASGRFEKSKKMQFIVKDQSLTDGQKEVVKDPVDYEETELNDDDGEEEEEEDEIEDDVAEELNAYGELDAAGENGDLSMQPSSYTDQQNISKNYLQELFNSFPFSEGGGLELPDAANSDDEYPIYEQYSEGHYSSDEDY